MREVLERRIDQALGRSTADLVIRNARILNLVSGELQPGDIAVCGDTIVGTLDSYRGMEEVDAQGRCAVPSFIDSHVHCESTLVTPAEFDRCVLPHGVTTAICDPHELCNVLALTVCNIFSMPPSSPLSTCGCSSLPVCPPPISRPRARGSPLSTCCRTGIILK